MKLSPQKIFRFRLRTKITGLVLLVVLLMMSTISFYNMWFDFQTRQNELDSRMQQITKAIAQLSNSLDTRSNWNIFQDYIYNIYQVLDNIVYIAVYDENGAVQAYVLNEDLVEIPPTVTVTDSLIKETVLQLDSRQVIPTQRFNILYFFLPVFLEELGYVGEGIGFGGDRIGRVRLGYSRMDLNNELVRIRDRNFNLFIIFIVFGLITSFYLSHRVTKPLTSLSSAMEKVPRGDTDIRVEVQSSDEVGSLASSFNYMVKELRENEFFNTFERDLGKVFTLDKIFITLLGRLGPLYGINKGALFIKQKKDGEYLEIYQSNFAVEFPLDFHRSLEKHLDKHLNKNEVCFSLEGLQIISREIPALRPVLEIVRANCIHWTIFLKRQETCMGVIYLGKNVEDFTVDLEEKKYIVNLVHHTLLPFEVALLHADLTEQERLKKEFEIARSVQANLLPQHMPDMDGYDIFGMCIPAREVGGDYFDFVEIDKHKIGIVIADVAGKSTSAAFYMAEIKGMIVSLSSLYSSPRELLKVLNSHLYFNVDRKVFASMIFGVLNVKANEFRFARAGHNPVILKRNTKPRVDFYTPEGLGLGLDRGKIFDRIIVEERIKLKDEDCILLYTDGLVESMNEHQDEFGEERLAEVLLHGNDVTAETACHEILGEIRNHAQSTEQFDDITMIMIKRKKLML